MYTSVLKTVCITIAVFAFAAAAHSFTGEAEDINPFLPEDWMERAHSPEDIKPLVKKRNLRAVGEDEQPMKKTMEPDTAVNSTDKKSGTENISDSATETVLIPATGTQPVIETGAIGKSEKREVLKEEYVRKKPRLGPISGLLRLKYQTSQATGDEIGFMSQNGLLFFNDKIQQSTRINVDKKYDNGISVEGRFVDEPYRDQFLSFNVKGKRGHALVGDIQTGFRGGEMVAFSKKARGLDVEYDFGPVTMFTMLSTEKSRTEREAFRGRNMRGPYPLRSTSLLEGSEAVSINGKPVSKADYSMDYFLGQITFNRNIDPSDLIEITYESVLQVSLKTGSLHGIGFYTDRSNRKYDAGLSYLEEGTSRTKDPAVFDRSMSPVSNVSNGQRIALEHNYIKINSEILILSINGETRYLNRGSDYTIVYYDGEYLYDNDLLGSVQLSDALLTSGEQEKPNTLSIRYDYYNTRYLQSVNEMIDISDYANADYVLSYERIYPGPEIVYYSDNSRRLQLFPYSTDNEVNAYYEIDEANNIIVFHWYGSIPDYSANPTIEINYEIVPSNTPGTYDAKRTVWDANGRITLGDADLRAEYAETTSDIALKTIQVTEERVATVSSSTVLMYYLDFPAILNTEAVYFNDTVSSSSRKRQGLDYIVEYDLEGNAYLRFKKEIPVGTTIIASYKYNPGISSDKVRTGKAGRILADWKIYGGTVGFEYMLKSPYFSPLTSFGNEERERIGLNLKYSPGKKWDTELNYRSHDNISDMRSGSYFTTKETGAQFRYKYKPGSYIAYIHENMTYRNRESLTDLGRVRNRLEGRYSHREGNIFSSNYHIETRDTGDATGKTSDQKALKYGVELFYRPGDKLNLSLSTNSNALKFDAPQNIDGIVIPDESGDFKTSTVSNVLDISYFPVPLWTLNARLDTQEISDNREIADSDSVHTIHTSVFSKPFGKFRRVYFGFDRRDRPNPYFGDSRTETAGTKVAYEISKKWTATPSFTLTKSRIQAKSKSDSNNTGLLLDYRAGAANGWLGSIQYSIDNRKNVSSNQTNTGWSPSGNSQSRTTLTSRYISGQKYEWSNSFIYANGDDFSYGGRMNLSSILDYRYSRKTVFNLSYNMESTGSAGDRTRIQVGSATEFGEYFTLGMSIKRERQAGFPAKRGYIGTLFNMTLDMKF